MLSPINITELRHYDLRQILRTGLNVLWVKQVAFLDEDWTKMDTFWDLATFQKEHIFLYIRQILEIEPPDAKTAYKQE